MSSPLGSPRAASAVGFLYWSGWQAMVPFLALYATSLGASPATVGIILGSYSILALLLSVPAGLLAERIGSGRMMFGGALLGGVSLLLIVYGGGLAGLTIGLTLLGVSQIMVSIGTQVETILGASQKDLPRAITQYFFFSSASQLSGPAIGAVLVRGAHYSLAFLGAAGLSFLAMLAAAGPARRPPVRDAVVARPPALETITTTLTHRPGARAGLLVNLAAELAMAFWASFFPLLLAQRGYGSETIAFLFGLRATSNTGVRLVMGRITQRLSRTRALVVGLIVTGLSLVAMAAFVPLWGIALAVLVFGFSMGLYSTLAAIAVAAGFTADAAGLGVGLRMLASRIGLIVGPIVTGLVVQGFGYIAAFVVSAVICASPALLYARRSRPSALRAARERARDAGAGLPPR
ncbi:MAG: MFS transporter [Armatimonadota bacterium]|nr:MFS transporter [Armatimonadota bacterium]